MVKYEELVRRFSWEKVGEEFSGKPDGEFNIAHEICDRWATDPNKIAVYWESVAGKKEVWTFRKLKEKSDRMANALKSRGIKKGDRVAGLLGKEMELVVTFIATWKIGAIYVPLFTAFGPDAILHRMEDAQVKLLLTNKKQYEKLVQKDITFDILLTDEKTEDGKTFWEYLDSFSANFQIEKTLGHDPAIIQYTSGTTGLPKGAIMKHKSLYSIYPYFKYAMHIEENDIFFVGPDLGWAFGLIACTLGPLKFGASVVLYNGRFKVERVYQLFESYQVTSTAYAPTAYRMMMAAGSDIVGKYKLKIRKFSSAGESLNAEVVNFFERNFGRAIYDHYGSTETSNIVNNYNILEMEIKPGSMGLPLPGYKVSIIDDNGRPVKRGETGQIAVEFNSERSCFSGYWNKPEKFKEKILGKWLLTGDLAKQDDDGYYWFQGRADDVITSAGYRIGPTEVEASLLEHPAVLEAAVVGKPDKLKGEIVKAFIVLNKEYKPSERLEQDLSEFVRNKLSKHQYPKEIEFMKELPKTQSGKIQRALLKKREYEKVEK